MSFFKKIFKPIKKIVKAPITILTHPKDLVKPKKLVEDITGINLSKHKSSTKAVVDPAVAAATAAQDAAAASAVARDVALHVPIVNTVRPAPAGASRGGGGPQLTSDSNNLGNYRTLLGA